MRAGRRLAPAPDALRHGSAVFALGDFGILVESPVPTHLAWLAEFLTPQLDCRPLSPHAHRVRVVEDAQQYREALACGPAGGTREAFAHDTKVVSLPRWQGAETRLFDAKLEVFLEVAAPRAASTPPGPEAATAAGAGVTRILCAPGSLRVRTALMRVVRELATNRAQRVGSGLLLHAAGFAVDGRGVLVGGPKGAGKTTLLLHALLRGEAEYLSNDRVLIGLDTRPPRARGVPSIVSLRPGTLDLFPALDARLAGTAHHHQLTLEEVAAGRPADPTRTDRRALSPAQLCLEVGARSCGECEVGAVVFPRVTHAPGGLALRRLDDAEAALRLSEAIFGLSTGRSTSEVFSVPGDPPAADHATLVARCRGLAARVPCFECRLGLNAFELARSATDLMAAVLG